MRALHAHSSGFHPCAAHSRWRLFPPERQPAHRAWITFDVRRFESRLDAPAAAQAEIDAIWSVRRMDENRKNARAALTCRAFARESTASDLHSISQGHRR